MRRFPISILLDTNFGVLTWFLGSNRGQQFVQWGYLPKLQTIVLHYSRYDYFWLSRAKSLSFIQSIWQKIPMHKFPISILKNTIFGFLTRLQGSNWGQQLVQWGRSAKIANHCSSHLTISDFHNTDAQISNFYFELHNLWCPHKVSEE